MTVLKNYDGSSWQPVAVGAQGLTGIQGISGPQGIQGITGSSSGGGMTLLSTTNLSGSTTSITGIDQTYTNLFILIKGQQTNSSGAMYIGFNSTYGSGFGNMAYYNGSSWSYKSDMTMQNQSTSQTQNSYAIQVFNYADTVVSKQVYINGVVLSGSNDGIIGTYTRAEAISSLQIIANGTTWAAGTVLIYGVK